MVSELQSIGINTSQPFIRRLLAMSSLVTITTEGDITKASAKFADRTVGLTMRRDANRWRVTSFDADAVVKRVVDGTMKDLPPIGTLDSANPLFKMPAKPRKKRR